MSPVVTPEQGFTREAKNKIQESESRSNLLLDKWFKLLPSMQIDPWRMAVCGSVDNSQGCQVLLDRNPNLLSIAWNISHLTTEQAVHSQRRNVQLNMQDVENVNKCPGTVEFLSVFCTVKYFYHYCRKLFGRMMGQQKEGPVSWWRLTERLWLHCLVQYSSWQRCFSFHFRNACDHIPDLILF